MSDTAYGSEKVFTPRLKRLSAVVILGSMMTILDTTIVNVAIHTLGSDFKVSVATIQWVATGYLLALSMVIPITGWAIERYGVRRLWLGSLVLFLAGSMLSGAAWSAGSLIFFRVLQGFAGGVILPVGQTILARESGPDKLGRVMGVIAVPALLGPVLGPVIGGAIIDGLSWRWIFYVNLPVGIVALAAALRWLGPDTHARLDKRLDRVGLALLSPGLAAFVYGLSEAGISGFASAKAIVGTAVGLVLIVAFVIHARRTEGAADRRDPVRGPHLRGERLDDVRLPGHALRGHVPVPALRAGGAGPDPAPGGPAARAAGARGDGLDAHRRQAQRQVRPAAARARRGSRSPCWPTCR